MFCVLVVYARTWMPSYNTEKYQSGWMQQCARAKSNAAKLHWPLAERAERSEQLLLSVNMNPCIHVGRKKTCYLLATHMQDLAEIDADMHSLTAHADALLATGFNCCVHG